MPWQTVKGSDGASPLSTTLAMHAFPMSVTPTIVVDHYWAVLIMHALTVLLILVKCIQILNLFDKEIILYQTYSILY
jgi:hypothetical protein